MKKIFNVVFLSVSAIALMVGCKEKGVTEPAQNTLEVTPSEDMVFKASANEDQILNIKTDAEEWSFTAPDWVEAVKASRSLTVNVKDNTSTTEARNGKIEFKAGNAKPVVVNISQGFAEDLTVTPSELPDFKAKGNDDVTLTVTTNLSEWSYEVEQNGEWLSVTRAENILTVKVSDNEVKEPREGKIVITAGENKKTIAVRQQAKGDVSLTVTPSELPQFKAKGNAETTLTVDTDADGWTYTVPEWITAAKEENVLKLNVDDNVVTEPREGVIEIKAEDKIVSVNVSQAPAATLSVSPESLPEFAFTSPQTQEITVTTNVPEWTFTAPEWIVATKEENILKVTAQNNTGSERSGEITITAEDKEAKVAVSQAAFIDVEPGKPIKNIFYCEVNNTNPLNALEYKLNNGSYFFDAVVIFSANIVYNAQNQKIELSLNDNVKTLMEQNKTYLQPLRDAGMKVYMGLLGHHTYAGLCNLTETGADQFASVVANAVKNYNIDGVAMDDEYQEGSSNPNPALFENSSSIKGGARLCTAIKQKIGADKEVVVFGFNRFQYFYYQGSKLGSAVSPYVPSEYMDIYVPNYGGYETTIADPFTGMTKKDMAGRSYELNKLKGNVDFDPGYMNLTKSGLTLDQLKGYVRDGYGYFMWFAFDPNPASGIYNLSSSLKAFDRACQGMEGNRRIMLPTHYYKKGGEGTFDTQRYEYTPDQLPEL